MNAFVLAGGQSTRMGRDKALLAWQGSTLIELALEKLREVSAEPRIVGTRPDLQRFAPVIQDNFPAVGPLGGIEAALNATDTDLNLFLSVDLPLLPVRFLRWMISRAGLTEAAATIPQVESRPHPLCAIYHRCLLDGIRVSLGRGDGKVMRAIENAARDSGTHIDRFDIETVAAAQADGEPGIDAWPRGILTHRWFENLNTPGEAARAASMHRS
jgi:molybdopterin-guanine dinucleotide biosynthesis protein A